MVENLPPMRPVDTVQVPPPNPFGSGRIVRELAFMALALVILVAIRVGWEIVALAMVFWLGHWGVWGWIGYRKWRAWRDGPPVADG